MNELFKKKLLAEMNNHHFLEFDTFIINKMGFGNINEPVSDINRKLAYIEFRERTDMLELASVPTMKKWFGIGGIATPRRENIFEMAFALKLSAEEAEEYLLKGIKHAGFQINDYQEAIFLYGLYNNLSYEYCLQMIQSYQLSLENQQIYLKTFTTKQLKKQFMNNHSLSPDRFLQWMLDRAEHFKGYSVTAMNYLEQYKKTIIHYIRQDASKVLDLLLSEAGYGIWKKKHFLLKGTDKQLISKFIKSKSDIPSDLVNSIAELSKMVHSELEPNTMIISAIYSKVNTSNSENANHTNIHTVTNKYLSDLYNYPLMQQRAIRTSKAIAELEILDDNSECPEWIIELINYYSKGKTVIKNKNEALMWLNNDYSDHRRRRILAKRDDLLPMILFVAQRNYLLTIDEDMSLYNKEDALEQFNKMANSSLAACNMDLLSNNYELDVALTACYQEDDMYTYQDVLDIVYDSV
ncbi:MAG: hypothetical protein E7265_03195 [Lachnospiraceae bacterium]|nr:hypothetical protein [Lachnospiraceae bacterium]